MELKAQCENQREGRKHKEPFWSWPTAEALGLSSSPLRLSSLHPHRGHPRLSRSEEEDGLDGFDIFQDIRERPLSSSRQQDLSSSVSDLVYLSPPDPLDFAFLPSASLTLPQPFRRTSSLSLHSSSRAPLSHTASLSSTSLGYHRGRRFLTPHEIDVFSPSSSSTSYVPPEDSPSNPKTSAPSVISFISTQLHAFTPTNSTMPTLPVPIQPVLPPAVARPTIQLPPSPGVVAAPVLPTVQAAVPPSPMMAPAIPTPVPVLPPQPQAVASPAAGAPPTPQANLTALKTVEEETTREILKKAAEVGAKNVTISLTPDSAILATSQIGQPLTTQQILAIQTAAEQNVARELEALANAKHQAPLSTTTTVHSQGKQLLVLSSWAVPLLGSWISFI
ncbi:hypothetical protein CSUI_000104 [Cystoisospora suis]|uniref:Uncharacterized protein n=1 Tax=Cystoisospora suis TaxID=483139 RepID=A0A2C6LDF2_9APIC|nr:hypothetical protein CSUI_000104 [Cystoisospora suis]